MDRVFAGTASPLRLGVAVSGGSDSLALMHLLIDWAATRDAMLLVATVDHGLRPEAAAEAENVAQLARAIGLRHITLRWAGWDGDGNLADSARQARYRLLGDWAAAERLDGVALGHTQDDQAETVLMNLSRGSGVEGLSGIAERHRLHGYQVFRPLLETSRAALQEELRARGAAWIDDPSNADPASDRVKARRAVGELETLGINAEGLAATAKRMSAARDALEARARTFAEKIAVEHHGDLIIKAEELFEIEPDTRHRVFAAALRWVASDPYRPRLAALTRVLEALEAGKDGTLNGCLIRRKNEKIRVSRELKAVEKNTVPAGPGAVWDKRWRIAQNAQIPPDAHLAAVCADGLAQIAATGHEVPEGAPPRESQAAAPGLWQDERLIAAPLAGFGPAETIIFVPPEGGFLDTILSH